MRKRERLGEDIAFGMQQTLACWATDFIDPYVGKWVQDKFKDSQHESTLAHTWTGEIIGDSVAFFAFLGIQRFLPKPVEWLKQSAKSMFNRVYEHTGRKELIRSGVSKSSPDYRRKLEEWKEFQADNFAKSAVISLSSIAANVTTQKIMGNTHKWAVITASKVIGAAITMAAMLGMRFLIPKTTRQLDEELSNRYFTPLIHKTQKLFGAHEAGGDEPGKKSAHTDRIRERREEVLYSHSR